MSKKRFGLFAGILLLGVSVLLVNCGTSSSRPAGVLYVLSQGEASVGSYAINLDDGRLSLINSTVETGSAPLSILLDPSNTVAFVLNTAANTITAYTVNNDGTLTKASGETAVPPNSVAMTRDSAGSLLFVASQSPANQQPPCQSQQCGISVFAMQSGSTTLTPVETRVLTRVPTAVAVGAGALGNLLFVTSNQDQNPANDDNEVSVFNLDSSGHISPPGADLPGSPYSVGSNPGAVLAVKTSPVGGSGGLFVYVANSGNGSNGNSISVFQVCTVLNGGTCSAQDDINNAKMNPVGAPVSVGLAPIAMTIDPTNNFLFAVNHDSSTVSGFRINLGTGALSALNPATVSTGAGPVAIAMHPSGKFLFVSNNGGSNVSGYTVDTTSGKLSNATNITSDAQPSGLVAK